MRQAQTCLVIIIIIATSCTQDHSKEAEGTHRYITLYNSKIHFEEYGHGAPLLLLQGGGIERSSKDFASIIPALVQHYRLIIPDSPGQGLSELADSLSYQLLTNYTSALIDSLKLDSAYIIGFSDGGIVGLLLAEKRADKIKKVIAIGANNGVRAVLPPGFDESLVSPDPIDTWEQRNKSTIDRYVKTLPRDWKKFINDQNKMWYQSEYFPDSILKRITIPVMITQGDQDMIRVEHAVELHRLIKNSQLCIFPNTSHEVIAEHPDLLNTIALKFFGNTNK